MLPVVLIVLKRGEVGGFPNVHKSCQSERKEGRALNVSPAARRFGQLLKDYRKNLGLSQRSLAAFLEVDESTIARMEAGTRKPPRSVGFYEKLRQVPGLTEEEIQTLLQTSDAPRWLVPERGAAEETEQAGIRSRVASVEGGPKIRLIYEPDPTGIKLTDEELEVLKEIVAEDVELFLKRKKRMYAQSELVGSGSGPDIGD